MPETDDYRLKIEAYTPDTMPMQRLAEYLAELASMLGERTSVHFVRLEPGSTSIVHRIEREAIPKIRERTNSVRRGVGPRDSVRAYRKINRMLREDNGSAVWREESTATEIIVFPGKDDAAESVTGISQHGSLDGEVIRVGGSRPVVPIILKSDTEDFAGCWARRDVAKALAQKLFEPVRLFGTGRWNRTDDGQWKLDIFRVESFVSLREASLSQALSQLRAIKSDWNAASFDELTQLRSDGEDILHGGV